MTRLVSLALVIAAMASTSGCVILAVPPIVSASVGASVGAARRHDTGATIGDVLLGALVGVAVDVGFLYYVTKNSSD